MKTYLRIKRNHLWKICAIVVLAIVLDACYIKIQQIDQPATAKVGDVITIKLKDTVQTNQETGPRNPEVTHYVLGMLMPKGWNAGDPNITTVTYTSQLGDGTMMPMPDAAIEPSNTSHLNWPDAMMAKFGIGKNLVNDVEWVVFESTQEITIHNTDKFNPNPTIKIKVGADGNDTYFFPAYVICGAYDGISEDASWHNGFDFDKADGDCLMVTNGTTGDINDYCHPQLATVDPPKSLDNDFITITYNGGLQTTALTGKTDLYLCVDAIYLADGSTLTSGFCTQTQKSKLTETSDHNGTYRITIWPHSYFGLTDGQSITKIDYHVTDATGNIRVGLNNTADAFTYKFKCN